MKVKDFGFIIKVCMRGPGKHWPIFLLRREKTSVVREKDHALHVPVVQIAGPYAQVAGRAAPQPAHRDMAPGGGFGTGGASHSLILSLILNAETGYFTEM